MPTSDSDLEYLRRRYNPGSLYRFENEKDLNIWYSNQPKKFARKLKTGQTFMFLRLDRSPLASSGFRLHLLRGEEVGYVLLKRYEVVTCLKFLDTGSES